MDKNDVEILDDFDEEVNTNEVAPKNDDEEIILEEVEKKPEQNPVAEMLSNKKNIKFIIGLLVILFIAVFLMPKFFDLISKS